MKKFVVLGALAAALLCGCESVETETSRQPQGSEQTPEGDFVRLNLKAEDTRSSLSGEKILWSEGDHIMVNGSSYEILFDESGDAYVNVPFGESYKALYPAEIYTERGMMLQPAQFYAENSFGELANPMTGTGSSSELHMRSVCGALMLRIAGSATISSISITDRAGGALCGEFDYADGEASLLDDATVSHSSVVLNCMQAGGVKLSATGTDFYIVMPAATYSSGLKISISDTDGRNMVINSSTPRTIRANDILETPTITYAPDEDILLAQSFDKNVWGCERQSEVAGFAISGSTTAATGYELVTAVTDTYGTDAISTDWANADTYQMTASYLRSRGLEDWSMLYRCYEVYGALAVGYTGGRGFLRLPKLSLLDEGEVCKATLTFRIAFKDGAAADMVQLYPYVGGTGKVLAYYVDGVEVEIPKDGTRWTTGTDIGLPNETLQQEKLLIYPSIDIKDVEWHTIRVDFGAVTSTTQIHLQPHTKGTTTAEFLIDDVEVRKVAYPYQSDAIHHRDGQAITDANRSKVMFEPSTLVWIGSSPQMKYLATHAKAMGMKKIDVNLKTDWLYTTLGGEWADTFAEIKAQIDDAGMTVRCIHMPYEGIDDVNTFDFASSDTSLRTSAVAKMSELIEAVAVFEPEYILVHPSGYGASYVYSQNKNYLITSLNALIPICQSIGANLCLENAGNADSSENSITMKASYLNELVASCPGLSVCFDVTHATVKGFNDAAEFINELGSNISCIHMHDGDGTRDMHLYPGYSGIYAHSGTLNWGEVYKALVDIGFNGPFTYEISGYAVDCVYSYNALIHNYYDYVYPCYREAVK